MQRFMHPYPSYPTVPAKHFVIKGDQMTLKAGVIGLGMIGGGVAVCLARAGLLAAVYDIRANAADSLENVPSVSASPAVVARGCDVVLIAVVDARQVHDVLSGPDGVLAGKSAGLTIGLLSTVSMSELRDIRKRVLQGGAKFIDSGVTGGMRAAERGLVSLVGAAPGELEAVLPVYEAFSAHVALMGGPGAGMAAKIARNVMVYEVWRAGYEGACLAKAAGLDVLKLAEAIEVSAASVGGPTGWMLRPDPHEHPDEARFRESIHILLQKDLSAALELAAELGVSLPTAALTRESARLIMGLD